MEGGRSSLAEGILVAERSGAVCLITGHQGRGQATFRPLKNLVSTFSCRRETMKRRAEMCRNFRRAGLSIGLDMERSTYASLASELIHRDCAVIFKLFEAFERRKPLLNVVGNGICQWELTIVVSADAGIVTSNRVDGNIRDIHRQCFFYIIFLVQNFISFKS